MKWQIALTLSAVLAIAYAGGYTTKYDNTNIREMLENKKTLIFYLECILGRGPCTAEGTELKSHISDALKTGCEKCSDKQKEGAKLALKHVREHESKYWEELKAKFDPNNEYEPKYEDFLAGKI